jgi:hypothetical protein
MAVYGTVVKIFSETSLLVNLGKNAGVKRGDRFVVIERAGEEKDPESGESLGELELVKAELVAVDVQERMSILQTESLAADAMSVPLSTIMVRESIRTDGDQAKMPVAPGEISGNPSLSPVRVGDSVRLID